MWRALPSACIAWFGPWCLAPGLLSNGAGHPFTDDPALPFHYELILLVFLYMAWMTVSVFWQDYLTFGLPAGLRPGVASGDGCGRCT